MYKRKSWREKLADDKDLPRVFTIDESLSKRFGIGTMVIPAPREVDAIMKRVPTGKLITINEIRAVLSANDGGLGGRCTARAGEIPPRLRAGT